MAAEDRLTPKALAGLAGIQVGEALPDELYALGVVIREVIHDPGAVTLEIPLDETRLLRIFKAWRQLALAHLAQTSKSRFKVDPDEVPRLSDD